jgi:hypothetical protein
MVQNDNKCEEYEMSDILPPLPPGLFPSGIGPYYRASVVEQLRRDAYRQALEEAALHFERVGGMIDPRSIAAAIRALKDKP